MENSTKHVNDLGLYCIIAQSPSDDRKLKLLKILGQHLEATISLKPIFMERSEHFVSSDLFSFRSWSTLRLGMMRFAAFVFCLNTWQERTVTALTNYKSPLKNWVSASTKFKEHQLNSEFHKAAVGYAEDFLRVQDGKMPSISQQLSDIYRNTVELNRQKLRSIIKTVALCGKQNIALRGHRDGSSHIDEASGNSENFQALLNFLPHTGG